VGRADGALAQRRDLEAGRLNVPAWPAIAAAQRGDRAARVPFVVDGDPVGSIARAHLPALRQVIGAGWQVQDDGVALHGAALDATLAQVNAALRARGLIRAWRDEPYPLFGGAGGAVLAHIERASSRFWGTLTLGAHANGYVAGSDGRPVALWIAQRAFDKATDPGLHDNLIGGGVPAGQSPWMTLQREGWEEAGLDAGLLRQARPGRVLHIERDIPEGWQVEHLHVFDLALPPGVQPANQDGEVAGFECLPVARALALARSAAMTVDASLATLDFALRHDLLGDEAPTLAAAAAHLWRGHAHSA
jgi:8-oxo-dGTP pyrophosphatase MutT (NUDIX family)